MPKKNYLVKQKEDIALVEQEYSERSRLRRVRELNEQKDIEETIQLREEQKLEALKQMRSFGEFSRSIKNSLLAETMIMMFEASLPNDIKSNPMNKAIGINMINQYIKEEGVDNILTKVKYNSLFLSELARKVNTYHKAIIESVDKEDPDFKFNTGFKDDFYDSIKGEDFDEICDSIRMRVTDGIEDFVQSNINNKMDIEDVISSTKEKIDNASYSTGDDVKQEYANLGKRRIEEIKNRKHGLLEAIIHRVSKSAMLNESISEAYTSEDGSLNMDRIVESSSAIYTFLEMLNTAKFVDIDNNYIKSFLESIDYVEEKCGDKVKDLKKDVEKKVKDGIKKAKPNKPEFIPFSKRDKKKK